MLRTAGFQQIQLRRLKLSSTQQRLSKVAAAPPNQLEKTPAAQAGTGLPAGPFSGR
jgi:hypothetical protein